MGPELAIFWNIFPDLALSECCPIRLSIDGYQKKRLFVDLSTGIYAEYPVAWADRCWVGGLLGDLDASAIPRAPDHPVSSSLDVPTTREDRWDRDAIVRGSWDCQGSEW